MNKNIELEIKINDFEKNTEEVCFKKVDIRSKHAEFLKLFPFRKYPKLINNLTPEKVYNPKADKNYFFNWIEHKLKKLGHITVRSARPWNNARDNIEILKKLLKIVVNDSLPISKKIDAHWEDIKYFGGDRHIAKKILFCYYPEKIIPAYKTKDLEDFANMLDLEYKSISIKKYRKNYHLLSVGEKFELFNHLLSAFKNQHQRMEAWDNLSFGCFLYTCFPPLRITDKETNEK